MKSGFLVFPGVEELDFVGPWEIFTMWQSYADGPETIRTVGLSSDPITCAKGLKIIPDISLAEAPVFDQVLVPGGFAVFDLLECEAIRSFLIKNRENGADILSVCTGSFFLQAAGFLEGRHATTHWKAMDRLSKLPGVNAVQQRYTVDGNIWTSAGVSAGIDMALAYIEATAGREAAATVQLNAEYFPEGLDYREDPSP